MFPTEQQVQNVVPPWVAAFVRFGPGRKINLVEGAGALISPWWVLTAAHVVLDRRTTTVLLGTDQISTSPKGHMRHIAKVFRPPKYVELQTPPVFDLALVRLTKPYHAEEFSKRGRGGEFSELGEVFGWGQRVQRPTPYSDRMKQIAVTVDPPDGGPYLHARSAATLNTCYGDSGGPLLIRDEGRWVQIGITSSLTVARQCRDAGIYTPVAAHEAWIDETMANEGCQ